MMRKLGEQYLNMPIAMSVVELIQKRIGQLQHRFLHRALRVAFAAMDRPAKTAQSDQGAPYVPQRTRVCPRADRTAPASGPA
jgi:hypothetical protein